MTKEYYEKLATTCTAIINNPMENIQYIDDILKNKDDITLLALLKVFKNTIPLYKIKIKEDKINHKKEYIKLQNYDKAIYYSYKNYIQIICSVNSISSYKIAAVILNHLDHFNFAEKIIEKIFKGLSQKETKEICLKSIIEKLNADAIGDSSFKIILNLLEFKYCDEIYQGIVNINIINKLTYNDLKIEKESTASKEIIETRELKKRKKMLMKNKFGKNIEKSSLKSKIEKKVAVKMKKIESNVHLLKESEKEKQKRKMLTKIIDNVLRIYFIILNENKIKLYKYCFEGLINYKRFIKPEFYDGLLIMLNNIIENDDYTNKLYGINCVIAIYGERNYEFKNILEATYDLLTPLKYYFDEHEFSILLKTVQFLFLEKKQLQKITHLYINRLIQFNFLKYTPILSNIIKKIIVTYKIDIYDFDILNDGVYNIEDNNLMSNGSIPFYWANIYDKYNGFNK